MRFLPVSLVCAAALASPGLAQAQAEPRPLPPLAPPGAAPAPPPPSGEGPTEYVYLVPAPPPPPPRPVRRTEAVHAPPYSLYLGGRLGFLAYGGGMYTTSGNNPETETTGNFVTNGLAVELDAGARVARHFIPYLGAELGLVGAGHRFDGTSAHAGTSFIGVGIRMLAGDVDSVSFVSDISFGFRQIQVSNDGSTWSASSVEVLRLGLGAEIRLTNRFTISPLITLSGGKLTSTGGSVMFAPNQGDGVAGTPAPGGISTDDQTSYEAVVIGCGAHFDLFGR